MSPMKNHQTNWYISTFRPAILREVEVIESDMSTMKRESIILLMLEVVSERRPKKVSDPLAQLLFNALSTPIYSSQYFK